jgi:hypothetical protein
MTLADQIRRDKPLAGRHDTTEATRWASRSMDRPFTILEPTPL